MLINIQQAIAHSQKRFRGLDQYLNKEQPDQSINGRLGYAQPLMFMSSQLT